MKKILAIGCGGAGMFSAIVAAQLQKGEVEATVLSDEKDIYCRCTTPYIFSGEATLQEAVQPESMVTDYGVKIVHEKAVKLDTARKTVRTDKGNTFKYDYLVIATGATPVRPKIEGADGENVFTVRTSVDIENIERVLPRLKKAVVVGAGVIGLEMAGTLRAKGIEVAVVEYAPAIAAHLADPEFAEMITGHFKEGGVEMRFASEVTKIADGPAKTKLISVKSNDKEEIISADAVIMAVGVKPNLEITEGTAIKTTKFGIVVDKKMRTNVGGVYACGDCCVPVSAVTGENAPSQLASAAIQQSKVVGYQMSGFPVRYGGSTGACAFKSLGREYAVAGLTETEARKKFKWVVTGRASTTDVYRDLKARRPLEVKLIFAGPKLRLVGYEAFGHGVIASAEVASLAIGLRLSILKVLKYNYISHPSLTPWPFMDPIIMAAEDALGRVKKKFAAAFGKRAEK